MTMHLVGPYLNTISSRKAKQKPRTKIAQQRFLEAHAEYNRSMKRMGLHREMLSVEDYDLQVRGLLKSSKTSKIDTRDSKATPRQTPFIPSLNSIDNGQTPKKEPNVYSGERKLLGITILHKSCLQPVFSQQEAIDAAHMRR